MKCRRHHNNKGNRTVRSGKTRTQVREMAKRLGVPYGDGAGQSRIQEPEAKSRRAVAASVGTQQETATTSVSAAQK